MRFEWNRHNLAKIAAHGIGRDEAEQALRRGRSVQGVIRNGEKRYVAKGTTEQDRAIEIVYTRRKNKIRVITAWESRKVRKELLEDKR
jgi:uncharacterized DUF497 family protein